MRKSFFLRIRIPLLTFLLVASMGCQMMKGGGGGGKVKYPNAVTAEMRSEYALAENDFKAQRYPQAETAYQNFIQRYPYNELTDSAQFRVGQIQMLRKDYDGATATFDRLISKTPDPGVASRARVKAGISQFRLNNYQKSLDYFDKTNPSDLGENDRIKLGGLALTAIDKSGVSSERKGFYDAVLLDSYEDLGDSAVQSKYGSEAPLRQDVLSGLKSWTMKPAPVNQLDPRLPTYKAKVSEPYIDYKLGMSYYNAGDQKLAKKYLGRLNGRFPNDPLTREAQPVIAKLGGVKEGKEPKGPAGRVYKIGVILPLSGKYEVYGANTLKGMECAASVKAPCTGVNNIQIVSRDDQGDPALAVKAVDELVTQEKVSAIIGPLSSASAQAAAKRAEELNVVMISLAQKEGIPETGPRIFRFSLTPGEQVRAVLEESVKKRNKKLIAVLYPNSNYGKVLANTMKDMAPKYGANVTVSQGYNGTNNISDELRQLKLGVSQASSTVPLGFEALFIPDSYAAILKIVPSLKNAGIDNILLLGTNAWNDPSIATKSNGLLDQSVFLDIYFKESDSPAVKEFVQEFQSAYGGSPSTLEATGYDAVRFLGQALQNKKASSTNDVQQAVANMRGYRGVTGLRSFLPEREAQVEPYMLTIEGGVIKELK
ncbi:MAG: penicillin-binding protein activator [Deltaproteobacteria bacterium]|nr:penicillin-binding protein activator [Deltaproteobacteria bacterium]